MDISKIVKWSPSSNIYDDLRGVNLSLCPKVSPRSTSTIGYISPREIENRQVKRPTVSLILPTSTTTTSSNEQMTSLDTILSIDDTKQSSSSVESVEQEKKDLVVNKDYSFVSEEKDQSCICWTVHELIQLICLGLFACLIAMFAFTLIFYAFDVYWLEQPILNNSLWWLDHNDTNFTGIDYETIRATQMIDYNDEY